MFHFKKLFGPYSFLYRVMHFCPTHLIFFPLKVVIARSFFVKTTCFCRYRRDICLPYVSNCPRCLCHSPSINQDLHAAEVIEFFYKKKFEMYFNVMVLIVVAPLLGLISDLSIMLSKTCAQTQRI